jgi:tRNA pseudouridine65 synthase
VSEAINPAPALDIIYQDDVLVAINKPAGLLVHRSPIDRHETRFAVQLLRDQIGQRVYPVHRLDKPTSGVLLFALNSEVAKQVSEQLAQRQVAKRYLAVVRGHCPEQGHIDYPLREKLDKIADRDRQQQRPAQEAITDYSRLGCAEIPYAIDRYPSSRYSLIELRPATGRKHQLRRHMKHIGHPIIGDAKHGKGVHNRFFQEHYSCHRLLLACLSMQLTHPVSSQTLLLEAKLDASFSHVLQQLGWKRPAQLAGQLENQQTSQP